MISGSATPDVKKELVYVTFPLMIFGPPLVFDAGAWVVFALGSTQAVIARMIATKGANICNDRNFISASILNSDHYTAEGIIIIMDWRTQAQAEFIRAEQARAHGNEGLARVCARRAAGFAAREYFTRQGRIIQTPSAYVLLNFLAEDQSLPDELRRSAEYLTMRVNEDFKLPVDVDLIAEAKKLCRGLLKEEI
jgi:hypothetical protein